MPITSFDDAEGKTSASVSQVCASASAAASRTTATSAVSHLEAIQQSRNGRNSRLGPLSPKKNAHLPHYIPERMTFDSVSRIPAGTYSQAAEWTSPKREGAMDYARCKSLIAGSLVEHKGEQV